MSLTSVGVQDRSTSSSTRLVSVVLLCCWACRRLDSSRDSICSWHALKQSCKHTVHEFTHHTNTHLSAMISIEIWMLAYRVTANDLWQEASEVLGGQGGILALQIETLNSCHHTACCYHGWRTGDEVDICGNSTSMCYNDKVSTTDAPFSCKHLALASNGRPLTQRLAVRSPLSLLEELEQGPIPPNICSPPLECLCIVHLPLSVILCICLCISCVQRDK